MNLYIGQPLDEVAGRFPEPSLRYSMPNEEGTLTVLEYDGFMVGYDAADQIEFINIYSEKVNPGLNGGPRRHPGGPSGGKAGRTR